ncbi:murein transglycosylase [Micromonospora zingiberis]|uniref:Murein transglycosylase n=1 Tax=Micromonospora zingiberis TaxID=2053011 RepID=A0A4R0GN76_9ACTN|nr:lytic transglycosylase domain-containing protein [Micromonospora zingiberis]TCB99144.1 murein transglycosylase [Micromonospora zingiberis]
MADGEERIPLRPLRPATPLAGAAPDGPVSRLPRPRRPWLRSAEPTSGSAAAPGGDSAVPASDDRPTARKDAAPSAPGSDGEPTTKADDAPATKVDGEPAGRVDGEGGPDGTAAVSTPDSAPSSVRRRRTRFAHAVRLPGPRAAARATRDWSRRPSGRLTLPGVFLLALVAATVMAGAKVVPATIGAPRPVAADATAGGPGAGGLPPSSEAPPPGAAPPPEVPLPPGATPPNMPGTTAPTAPGGVVPITGRPSDALAGWAREVGAKAGIDPIAMQAYGYAELVLAETNRSCGLSWTTLAAIGFVESRHGQANNARLSPDGRAIPEIIGLPLDGQGGRMRIADTDRGELDGDTTYDRAIGPMQFIPTTWQEVGADADLDGRKDPHNIHDAALAAGIYLCKGNRNLTIPGDWWNAILSYNNVRPYAQDVFNTANRYGQASRT